MQTHKREETLAPHHGLCHNRFLSPGPVWLPWVGCQATWLHWHAREREQGIPLACRVKTTTKASVWGNGLVRSIPLFALSVSLFQPSSNPALLSQLGIHFQPLERKERYVRLLIMSSRQGLFFFLFLYETFKSQEISKSCFTLLNSIKV